MCDSEKKCVTRKMERTGREWQVTGGIMYDYFAPKLISG
jgi:hypothetical protein